jgi:hypothetical protein
MAPALAQEPAPTFAEEEIAVDELAVDALKEMAKALGGMNTIAFDADVTNEIVLESGQKIQYGGVLSFDVVKPNKMRIMVSTAAQERVFFADGEQFAMVAPRLKVYANFDARMKLGQLFDTLLNNYDIEIPLVDLFLIESHPDLLDRITEGYVVRPDLVNGKECMHYAFRQEMVDWQLWLGDDNRPCKLVITTRDDPSLPQYTAVLKWRDTPAAEMPEFTFRPPEDFSRAAIKPISAVAEGVGK